MTHTRGPEVAVLVTDMSGLSRLTQREGIFATASRILRMREILLPVLEDHGSAPTARGDHCRAVFPDPADALLAAFACQRALREHNRGLPPGRQLLLGGIGIDCGTDLSEAGPELLGGVADAAYELGENVAREGEVLVTRRVLERVRGDRRVGRVAFDRLEPDEVGGGRDLPALVGPHCYRASALPGEESGPVRAVRPRPRGPAEEGLRSLLARREAPGADVAAVDEEIRLRYVREMAVLLVSVGGHRSPAREQIARSREILGRVLTPFEPLLPAGETVLFFFAHPAVALAAATECARELEGAKLDPSQMVDRSDVVGALPSGVKVEAIGMRLAAEKALDVHMTMGFRFPDSNEQHALEIRRGIAQFHPRYPDKVDVALVLTENYLGEIIVGKASFEEGLRRGKIKVEGELEDVVKFFGCIEKPEEPEEISLTVR